MSLNPTLDAVQVQVVLECGLAAAGGYGTALVSAAKRPPWSVIVSGLLQTFLVGMAVALLLDWQRFVTVYLLAALVISAVIGAVLGPRGLKWLFAGIVAVLAVWVPAFKPPKEPPDGPPPSAPAS